MNEKEVPQELVTLSRRKSIYCNEMLLEGSCCSDDAYYSASGTAAELMWSSPSVVFLSLKDQSFHRSTEPAPLLYFAVCQNAALIGKAQSHKDNDHSFFSSSSAKISVLQHIYTGLELIRAWRKQSMRREGVFSVLGVCFQITNQRKNYMRQFQLQMCVMVISEI